MFSLVGNRHGKKVIRWAYVILAGVFITVLAGLAAAGLYAALTRSWNPRVLWLGPAVGLVATMLTLVVAWRTPLQRLPMLK